MKEVKTDMAVVDPEYDDEDERWKPQKERVMNTQMKRKQHQRKVFN